MTFVITFHPKYGYSWELRTHGGSLVAKPAGTDYWWYKSEVLDDVKRIKVGVFGAMILDNTPPQAER